MTVAEVTTLPPTTTTTTTSTSVPPTTTTTARPATTVTTAAPATTRATVATPTTAASSETGCHPSYVGACVPIASDVDCGGGTGNGPAYVYVKRFRVVGPDVYDLDRDGDGIACES